MKRLFEKVISVFLIVCHLAPSASAVRVKDMTLVEGGRDNQLVGYGLVVGVAGKGDSRNDQIVRTVANALARFGLNFFTNGTTLDTLQIAQNPLQSTQMKTENMAAVMVTADIPAFAKAGTRIDVTVSAMGDAKTIQGAVLLQTPLLGADEQVYAVAQGAIATGGFLGGESAPALQYQPGGPSLQAQFQNSGGGATVQKNHPTVGMIPGGALVEKEIPAHFVRDNSVELLLLNPDYASAARLAQAINLEFPQSAMAKNPGTVSVAVPDDFRGYEVNFIARMGAIEVEPDVPARIVINERTGTIIATANVRISTVAVSHGALVISVTSNAGVSQPLAAGAVGVERGALGETRQTRNTQTDVLEKAGSLRVIEDYPTIQQVAAALNALGLTTRDMMSIFQTMKRAGALQAELILN